MLMPLAIMTMRWINVTGDFLPSLLMIFHHIHLSDNGEDVWGPMAQLTWWSLEQYKHLPVANAARKALVDQMTGMFLNQWRLHGHVCENYLPHRNGTKVNGKIWPDECTFGTGTTFYHWGALNGFIAIMGNGYWQSKGQELET